LLAKEQVDAVLVTDSVNVTYLTGFSGESSYLLLSPSRTILISDSRFTQQIAEECPGLETHIRPPAQNLFAATAEVLHTVGLKAMSFESTPVTGAEWEMLRQMTPTLSWKPTRDRVESLRAIKDPSEVAQVREAIAIAERAFRAFQAMLQPTDSEKE